MTDWLKIATDAYESSTSYVDSNYRQKWDANIRAFNSRHPVGSKYLSDAYKHRSKGFRPKTRSIIRKNEAAAAMALFSNMDVVNVDAVDQDDFISVANGFLCKELLQHRLTKTIPWFKLCMGALQDAQTLGVVCSYDYWKYRSEKKTQETVDELGNTVEVEVVKVLEDEPCIELRPIENIRIDPASDWLDPVNSSPYFIDMIPMYVVDVKAMMSAENEKTGEPKWLKLSDEELSQATRTDPDTTRLQREENRQDRYEEERPLGDFETVWVHRNFVRLPEGEYVYYTLGTHHLLSKPRLIDEVYPIYGGKRPYTMGVVVIESHRPLPNGVADLAQPLQTETNEINNQRRDNVKLVLDKKYFVARGRQVDVEALVRGAPGGVTMVNNVNEDVREMEWNDVTASSYQEQNRIDVDLDELVGNFSTGSVQNNRQLNETVGGMKMLNQSASMMTEYLLSTFRETWIEPVLRHLMLLEQAYESDETVLALAAKKAKLFQRFGISQVTDEILKRELSLTINVGMGATNPDERLKKFLAATGAAYQMSMQSPPGADVKEIVKEIYSFAGFRDGARFFPDKVNPQVAQAMQIIQKLQGEIQSKDRELQAKMQMEQAQLASNERIKSAELQVDTFRVQGDLAIRQAEVEVERIRLELERMKSMAELQGKSVDVGLKIAEAQAKLQEIAIKLQSQREEFQIDKEKMYLDLQAKAADAAMKMLPVDSVQSSQRAVSEVTNAISSIMQEVANLKAQMDDEVVGSEKVMGPDGRMMGVRLKRASGKTREIQVA